MMPLNLRRVTLVDDYQAFGDPFWEKLSGLIDAMVVANHEILRHDLPRLSIDPCHGCGSCYSKEVACSYLDDFNQIPPDLNDSSVLLIAAEGHFSSTFYAFLSKLRSCEKAPRSMPLEKIVLLYEGSEKDYLIDRPFFQAAIGYCKAENIVVIRRDSFRFEELQELGKSI